MSDIADNNRRENHSSGEKNDTGFFKRLVDKVMKSYDYIMGGVWSDTRGSWKVNIMKTLSLTVKSFFNADLQTRAAALTYQTVLTIVPAPFRNRTWIRIPESSEEPVVQLYACAAECMGASS